MKCSTCTYDLSVLDPQAYTTRCPSCDGRLCPYCRDARTELVLPASSRWQSVGMRGTRFYISGCAPHCAEHAAMWARELVEDVLAGRNLPRAVLLWNDEPGRTVGEVLDLLNEAVSRLEVRQ